MCCLEISLAAQRMTSEGEDGVLCDKTDTKHLQKLSVSFSKRSLMLLSVAANPTQMELLKQCWAVIHLYDFVL